MLLATFVLTRSPEGMQPSVPSVNRPFLLRLLPSRLRMSVWARGYRRTAATRPELYTDAPLHFAPSVRMRLVPEM